MYVQKTILSYHWKNRVRGSLNILKLFKKYSMKNTKKRNFKIIYNSS